MWIRDIQMSLWCHYGEQGDIQRLRYMAWAGVVADEELAVGDERCQFPYRAGLDMVKHVSLQRGGQ